jgi:hypothetical protein
MYVDSWIYAPDMNFARPSFVEELLQQKFRSEVSVTLNRKASCSSGALCYVSGSVGGWGVVEGEQHCSPWARRND